MRLCLVYLVAVLACTAAWAADNPALGKWNCISTAENGVKLNFSLVVMEKAGELNAVATLDGTDMSLLEPKVEGSTLTFKLRVNEHEVVSFELHIEGNKLSGRFEGAESGKATITGTKAM